MHSPRVPTGNPTLDEGLGGGLPGGSLALVEGAPGAGANEFAYAALRATISTGKGRRGRFASALRSPARAEREAQAVLADPKAAAAIVFDELRPEPVRRAVEAVAQLTEGEVLVVESASAVHGLVPGGIVEFERQLGDAAAAVGAVVILLHAPGSLGSVVEAAAREAADVVLHFAWRDLGPCRKRTLALTKLRGLGPALEGEEVPVFEVSLQRGSCYDLARVRTVL